MHDGPLWARALTDPELFRWEQARLGVLWTLLGVAQDVARDGDWFRATLGGRSVFVQRFGDTLRGFENVCAHRFFPLRTADKGNGPIRCGFHHWQYDDEGRAVGIPKCKEMFGVTPREMNRRLVPVELASCGPLIFGRFTGPGARPTLEEYLGEGFSIVQAMTDVGRLPAPVLSTFDANWKLGFHITMDDYHQPAVHADTVGRHGYKYTAGDRYYRLGHHSAYLRGRRDDTPSSMAAACRAGSYRPRWYRIFNFFPNVVALHFLAATRWFILLQHFVPVAVDRTVLRSWIFRAPFAEFKPSLRRFAARVMTDPFLPLAVPWTVRKINGEDARACERLQDVAGQIEGLPLLGREEERIGWFQEAYAECVGPELAGNASSEKIVWHPTVTVSKAAN